MNYVSSRCCASGRLSEARVRARSWMGVRGHLGGAPYLVAQHRLRHRYQRATICYPCWAVDTWILTKSRRSYGQLSEASREEARGARVEVAQMRLGANATNQQLDAEVPKVAVSLKAMTQVPATVTLRVLGRPHNRVENTTSSTKPVSKLRGQHTAARHPCGKPPAVCNRNFEFSTTECSRPSHGQQGPGVGRGNICAGYEVSKCA